MRKNWVEVIIHILFWICTSWLIASSFSILSQEIEVINGEEKIVTIRNGSLTYQILLCVLVSFIAFYVNTWFISKKNQSLKIRKLIVFSGLTFTTLSALIYFISENNLCGDAPLIPKQVAFGIASFYFSISVAVALTKNAIHNDRRHQQLILDKRQTELSLLRNQLQPHFLFNALNNLLSMVDSSINPRLADAIDKLSQLLRFVMEHDNNEKISISKEIEFLKSYIDLQKLRFEEGEIAIEFKILGKNNQIKIEPGLFIPFVENAFKYGTEPERLSKIVIQFDLTNSEEVIFEIRNDIRNNNLNGNNKGIKSTKKRLELIYPNKHKLLISKDEQFVVYLSIYTT